MRDRATPPPGTPGWPSRQPSRHDKPAQRRGNNESRRQHDPVWRCEPTDHDPTNDEPANDEPADTSWPPRRSTAQPKLSVSAPAIIGSRGANRSCRRTSYRTQPGALSASAEFVRASCLHRFPGGSDPSGIRRHSRTNGASGGASQGPPRRRQGPGPSEGTGSAHRVRPGRR